MKERNPAATEKVGNISGRKNPGEQEGDMQKDKHICDQMVRTKVERRRLGGGRGAERSACEYKDSRVDLMN